MPAFRLRFANQFGLLAAALIFCGIGVGVYWGSQRYIADATAVAHSNQVIAAIDAIHAELRDAESAQRGYLLTGEIDYLADYRGRRDSLQPDFDRLQALVRDNPDQLGRARGLREMSEQRIAQIEATLAGYAQGGLMAAQAHIGREVLDTSRAIRVQARAMLEAERELLIGRDVSSRHSAGILRALALLGIPLGIAMVGLVYWLLLHEIRRRARAEHASTDAQRRLLDSVEQLEQGTANLHELSRYGRLLQSCLDADEAIALAAGLFSKLLPEAGGTLYRIRASQDYAEEVAQWGEHTMASAAMLPPGDCWALRRGQSHGRRTGEAGVSCQHVAGSSAVDIASTLCVPLVAQGTQLGFIYLSATADAFHARAELVETAAEQLSMALFNLELQRRLRIQSIREPLTGLFNRRYLEESLERELARCRRRGLPLALLMLDLDHFKAFNDLHGHPGGDALLAGFGQLLQSLSRPEDIACRYGGEEFTLILPETGEPAALQRSETIRVAVEAMRVQHLGAELDCATVSIGLAVHPDHGDSVEILLRRADQALYQAKRDGRNRVRSAGASLPRSAPAAGNGDS